LFVEADGERSSRLQASSSLTHTRLVPCVHCCRLPFYYLIKVAVVIYLWHPRSRGIKPVHEKLSKVNDIYIYSIYIFMLVEVTLYLYPRTGGSQLSRGEERNAESEVVFGWWCAQVMPGFLKSE
jgi:hypothetical protein